MSNRYDAGWTGVDGWRLRKTKVAERVRGVVRRALRIVWSWEEVREVRVACVPAGRRLGFRRRLDGGMVIVRDEHMAVVARRMEDIDAAEKYIVSSRSRKMKKERLSR